MNKPDILPLDTETRIGRIKAVGYITGERYYWIVDKQGAVSMIPAFAMGQYPPESPDLDKS